MEKFDRLRAIVARILEIPPDDLSPDTRFGELVPDSLAFVEFTMGLEEECFVEFRGDLPASLERWQEMTLLELASYLD